MDSIDPFQKAELLSALTKRIGFALWQLQELEWATANFVVIRLHAHRGIGKEEGNKLLEASGKQTFGFLLKALVNADVIDPVFADQLRKVLEERNWLVHRSRRENRGVLNSPSRYEALMERLDKISGDALILQKRIAMLMEQYVVQAGVSQEFIERESERMLRQWGVL